MELERVSFVHEMQYLKFVPLNPDLKGSFRDFTCSPGTLFNTYPLSLSAAQERMLSGGRRKSRILRYLQRAYPSPLLSFAAWRLTQREVVALIPEIERTESTFRDRRAWCEKMQAYNATVRRGVQLGLAPPGCSNSFLVQKNTFESLDTFLLCVHSAELTVIINGLSTFAERVRTAIHSGLDLGSNGRIWHLGGAIRMSSDSWIMFCEAVVDLLALLGLRSHRSGESESDSEPPSPPTPLLTTFHPWPDHDILSRAGARALALIGPFATPSERIITVADAECQRRRRAAENPPVAPPRAAPPGPTPGNATI